MKYTWVFEIIGVGAIKELLTEEDALKEAKTLAEIAKATVWVLLNNQVLPNYVVQCS